MDNTLSYLQHRTKYAKKWRGKLFTHAIALCDEFVNNPKVCNFFKNQFYSNDSFVFRYFSLGSLSTYSNTNSVGERIRI